MDEQLPLMVFLAAVVAILAFAVIHELHAPLPTSGTNGASLEPQSTSANVTTNATGASTTTDENATTPTTTNTTPTSSPTPVTPSPAPAQADASAPNATTNVTAPANATTNETISWNVTLADQSACAPPTLGVPVCAPTGSTPTDAKTLGTRDVTMGALDATWQDASGGTTGITMSLVAGADCTASGCSAQRSLNLSTSGPGPLHMTVGAVTLHANETLELVLTMDCSTTFGSCAGTSQDVRVTGWLLRP